MFAVAIDHLHGDHHHVGCFGQKARAQPFCPQISDGNSGAAAVLVRYKNLQIFISGRDPCVTVLLLVRLLHTDDTDPSDGDLSCMLSWKTGKLHVADSIKGDYRSGDPVYYTDPYQ